MKVQVEKKPESVSTLKIELPAEEVSKEWDTIANSFVRFAKIPGYRPGKAPRAVIDKRFRKEIQDEVTKKLVSKSYREAIGQFLADDWVIIDPDGSIIDKSRFLSVIKSGTLTHEMMESEDMKVRSYGDSAVVTALTKTKGKFAGQEFTTQERPTDVFVKQGGRWRYAFSQLTKFNKK